MKPALHLAFALAAVPSAAQDCAPELTSSVSPHGSFGAALAMTERTLAVAAPGTDSPGGVGGPFPYGRAEVFVYDGVTGALTRDGYLGPGPSPLPVVNREGFASAVALTRDGAGTLWAFCGWPDDITGGNGTVRPFRRDPLGWVEEPPILPPQASATGRFGVALAAAGDVLVVGEELGDGFAHVYLRDPMVGWRFSQSLTAPVPWNGTFGRALAAQRRGLLAPDAALIAVGDPGHPGALSGTGRVHVFRRAPSGAATWTHAQVLSGSAAVRDRFGAALGLSEDWLGVGDPERLLGSGGLGAVHLFRDVAGVLTPAGALQAPAGSAGGLGAAVAMGRRALLAGAPWADAGGAVGAGEARGLVRADDLPATPFVPTGPFHLASPAAGAMLGASVAVGEGLGAIGAPAAGTLAFGRVRLVTLDAARDVDADGRQDACEAIGVQVSQCRPLWNSTNAIARLHVEGDPTVLGGALTLAVDQLTPHCFGYLLTSRQLGLASMPGIPFGTLCLAAPVGRYNQTVLDSGAAGRVATQIGTALFPLPTGAAAGVPGETWTFQYWHRDVGPSQASTNFSEAVSVLLR